MLFKFKSRVTGDLIMLEPVGRRVLQIIGKTPDPQGIITVAQIPGAIAALQKAVDEEESAAAAAPRDGAAVETADDMKDPSERVWLRQRVVPFIEMLQTAAAHGRDVVW